MKEIRALNRRSMQLDLNKKAQEIMERAQAMGQEQNFLFLSQFKQFVVLINTLSKLEKELDNNDIMVTKEYVKGRRNIYTNPIINEYVKVSNAANNTATTLVKIITGLSKEKVKDNVEEKKNSLLDIING